jgi:glycosyltransferase involved in cell wall biosynthesis
MISIITPCFNLKDFIAATYQSIKSQTLEDWEWIIVDDASEDDTLSIIDGFNDSRIKLIRSVHTGNLAILRNKGAAIAQGKYLAFIDGDDLCEPQKFELQTEQLNTIPEIGWNHTNVRILREETGKLEKRKAPIYSCSVLQAENAFALLAYRNFICVSSVMVRKEVFDDVGGFDEQFNRCEDINLWLRLSANGYALGYIKKPLLQYRVRTSGLYVSKTFEYLKMDFVVYDDIKLKYPVLALKYQDVIQKHLSDINLKIAIRLLYQMDDSSNDYFLQAIRRSPSFKKLLWYCSSRLMPALVRRYLKNKLS